MDHPLKLGFWGTGGGTATMFFAELAEKTPKWEVFDKVIYRVGATAAAVSSILMVVLMTYRVLKARKETLESLKSDKHD